jgi:hypothetical protein
MNFSEARQIAETWVKVTTGGQAVLYREKTLSLPYGWVFFYNSPTFIAEPTNVDTSLVGNVPILIERVNGELKVLGPRHQERLKQIEKELPPACLLMSPEQAKW